MSDEFEPAPAWIAKKFDAPYYAEITHLWGPVHEIKYTNGTMQLTPESLTLFGRRHAEWKARRRVARINRVRPSWRVD